MKDNKEISTNNEEDEFKINKEWIREHIVVIDIAIFILMFSILIIMVWRIDVFTNNALEYFEKTHNLICYCTQNFTRF